MKTKDKQRKIQLAMLERAVKGLYHNATLGRFPDVPKGLESEAWDQFQFYCDIAIDDINNDCMGAEGDYIEHRILKYGKVGCYGRGGRTCIPKSWASSRGAYWSVKEAEDIAEGYSYGKIWELIRDIEDWNNYVKTYCSKDSIADMLEFWLDERTAEIEAEKKRAAYMLTV